MNQDTMLTTLVVIKAGPVVRIHRLDQRREPPCSQTVSDSVSTDPSIRTGDEGASNMGGCLYPRPFSRWIRQTPREHVLPAPQDLGRWGPHADSHILCRPRNRRGIHIFGVSKPELARIDVDAGARAEDLRERLAQYARKNAPGLMAREWAHESRAAR